MYFNVLANVRVLYIHRQRGETASKQQTVNMSREWRVAFPRITCDVCTCFLWHWGKKKGMPLF